MVKTNIKHITDVGLRSQNEDSYRIIENRYGVKLLVVADGMGGHNAGEVASKMACDIIGNAFKEIDRAIDYKSFIRDVIVTANQEIYQKSLLEREYSKMGTTVSLAIIDENMMYTGHVGDSRIYYSSESTFIQITKDHTLVQALMDGGNLSYQEAEKSKYKNVLLQALGTSKKITIEIKEVRLPNECLILLCSDGLTGPIKDEVLSEILLNGDTLEHRLESLVTLANNLDGGDNITIVALERGI